LVVAHNAQFERVLLNGLPGQEIGFPRTAIDQWVCTAAKTAAHGLPRKLEDAAAAAGTTAKNAFGKQDMMFLCKPRKGETTRATPQTHPERYVGLYVYNMDDVRAERALDVYVPDLPAYEQRVWELDQLINDRGMRVDLKAIADAQAILTQYKKALADKCVQVCGLKPTQREALAEWIRGPGGYPQLEDLQAQTVIKIIDEHDVPALVRTILKIYTYYGMKAVTKFTAIERAVCADGRVRGMYIYFGAATGR
jgi:DNA polymerase